MHTYTVLPPLYASLSFSLAPGKGGINISVQMNSDENVAGLEKCLDVCIYMHHGYGYIIQQPKDGNRIREPFF